MSAPVLRTTHRLNGYQTAVLDSGHAVEGTVLMLHSLGLDGAAFDALRAELAPTWRVLSYDLRGHGSANEVHTFSLADYIEDALAMLALCGTGPVHMVGHSLGGAIAASAASRAGASISSLGIVASPAIGMPAFADRGTPALEGGMPVVIEGTLARWFGEHPNTIWPTQSRYASQALLNMHPTAFAMAWYALSTFAGYADIAAHLPRSLCVAAAADLSTPPAVMKKIVDGCASAGVAVPLAVVEQHGHMLPLTGAAALAAVLQQHWRKGDAVSLSSSEAR